MTEKELADRYYRIYTEQIRRAGAATGLRDAVLELEGNVIAAYGGDGHFLTQVVGLARAKPELWKEIDAWYKGRTASYEAAICPVDRWEAFGELGAFGFQSFAWTRVSARKTDDPPPINADVRRIDPSEANLWPLTLARGDLAKAEMFRAMAEMVGGEMFFAEVEGKTVGGSLLLETEDGAYLSCGGVFPEYRNRGLHTAMIAARLHHLGPGKIAFFEANAWSVSARNGARAGFVPVMDNLLLRKWL
ncbi:hypothetical protein BH11ARM2_BH11ARM2_14710 [soil metagenome]